MTMEEKLEKIMDSVYKICRALVLVSDFNCNLYDIEEEIESARSFVKQYEQDHKGELNNANND